MLRFSISVGIVVAAASSLFSAPPPRYFPLDPGNEWTYTEEERPQADDFVVKVTAVDNGTASVDFGGVAARIKDRQSELDIEIEGEGFVPYYRFDEEEFLHRDLFSCNDNLKLTAVSRDETVETPAGVFTGCLKLDYQGSVCADAGGVSEWWKLDVGRVKFVEESFIGLRVHVLKSFTSTPAPRVFRRGDSDANTHAELTDAVFTLGWLFLGGPAPACEDAADTNDDGQVDIGDPISLLGYLFLGSDPPPAPGPVDCGEDPTADNLESCQGASCGEA